MKKKILAMILALALAMGLAGCGALPETAGTIGDVSISGQMYQFIQYNAYQAASLYTYKDDVLKEEITIDGVTQTGAEYVAEKTQRDLNFYAGVETLYAELGGQLSQAELDQATAQADAMWEAYKDGLEKNGMTRDVVQEYMENMMKITALITMIHGPQGTEPVADEEVQNFIDENYRLGQYLIFPYYDPTLLGYLPEEDQGEVLKIAEKAKADLEKGKEITEVAKTYLPEALPLVNQEYTDEEINSYVGGTLYMPASADTFGEVLSEGILSTKPGQVAVLEDAAMVMIFVAEDVGGVYTLEDLRAAALVDMKGDELDARYLEKGESLPHNLDKAALDKLAPSKLKK
ncbi:MAG: hypothetical protein IIV90_01780 [Oscillospiraceae bacterium]|nr:hypothetical protein [Oscillospiraceae bacterium]